MIKGIQVKVDPKYSQLYEQIGKFVKPGWGILDCSSCKEAPVFSEEYYRYVAGVILPSGCLLDEKYVPNEKWLSGVCFDVHEDGSTLAEAREMLNSLKGKAGFAYIKLRVSDSESALIDQAIRIAYHCQTLGVVPILGVWFPESITIQNAQLIYLTITEKLNDRKVFLEGILIEVSLVDTHNERLSLQNLVVLRRTISSLVSSVIVRIDNTLLQRKDVFNLSFTKGIKPPWVLGFSLSGASGISDVEKAAYQCAGIE